MRIPVDIRKSIETGRLYATHLDTEQKFGVAMYIMLASLFVSIGLVWPTWLLSQLIKNGDGNLVVVVYLGVFYSAGFLTLYGIVNETRLIRIRGKDLRANKHAMLAVLKETYNTNLIYEGSELFSYYKRSDCLHFATRVVVLFDSNDVLINISRFNQYGMKSFFHPAFSRSTVKSIKENFLRTINNS